jgi:tetratricopeptide (TPR) repeat protein
MRRGGNGEPRRGFGRHVSAWTFRQAAVAIVLAAGLSLGGAATAYAAQYSPSPGEVIRIRPNKQLFVTLCALYAAGYPEMPSHIPPQLQQLVRQLATMSDPQVVALRQFYQQHKKATPSATLKPYISLAMVVGPPPHFHYVVPESGIPPSVNDLKGFRGLLGAFYTQDNIDRLWKQVKPFYEADAAQIRGPVSQVVTEEKAYIRRMYAFQGGRTFTVDVDPLIGSATNFRIYSERYRIAVNPAEPGTVAAIRRAFLYFLVDPIVFNAQGEVDRLHYLQYYARKAPRLPEDYKYDFASFVDECLVRAMLLRMGNFSPPQLAGTLQRDDRDGYVLVRPLYEALKGYQHSQVSFLQYFPTLMKSINVKQEGEREAQIDFAPAAGEPVTPKQARADKIFRLLNEANQDIATQQEKQAISLFQEVLQLDPKNTQAMYGLGVASALNGQGERAHELFEQVVASAQKAYVDPSTLAWSHVYLGRMNDLAGRRARAVSQYRAALAVSGLPTAARQAAESGVKRPYTPGVKTQHTTPH